LQPLLYHCISLSGSSRLARLPPTDKATNKCISSSSINLERVREDTSIAITGYYFIISLTTRKTTGWLMLTHCAGVLAAAADDGEHFLDFPSTFDAATAAVLGYCSVTMRI
jgi:hypothetical protein